MKPEKGGLTEAEIALMESALRFSRAEEKELTSAELELEQPFRQESERHTVQTGKDKNKTNN